MAKQTDRELIMRCLEKLDKIETQTTKTNGRVGVLEQGQKEMKEMQEDHEGRVTEIEGDHATFVKLRAENEKRKSEEKDTKRYYINIFFEHIFPWAMRALVTIVSVIFAIKYGVKLGG